VNAVMQLPAARAVLQAIAASSAGGVQMRAQNLPAY
jgi:hypothetical protein